jgi:hypothetical protein
MQINPDISTACDTLYQALAENTDSGAFDELTTVELMEIQNHINKTLIERFKPLQKGICALVQLETTLFNCRQD